MPVPVTTRPAVILAMSVLLKPEIVVWPLALVTPLEVNAAATDVTVVLAGIPGPLTGMPTEILVNADALRIAGLPLVVSPLELTLVSVVVPAIATVPVWVASPMMRPV